MKPYSLARSLASAILVAFVIALPSFLGVQSAYAQQTVYNITGGAANGLQQIAGGPSAQPLQPTFSSAVAINPNLGIVHKIAGVNSTSATCTVTTANVGQFGQFMVVQCAADSTGTVTYTFSTNFLPTATVAATASKSLSVIFFSDGVAWHELARSASAQ